MGIETLTHASAVKARLYPYYSALEPENIDRLQSLRLGWTRPNDMVYEAGEQDEIARDWQTPETTASAMMFENGSMDIWKILTNKNAETLNLEDFDDKYVDLVTFKRDVRSDEKGVLVKCIYEPYMTLSGFGINIADPEAKIERSFDLVGDAYTTIYEGNKGFCYTDLVVESGKEDANCEIDLSSNPPVKNPDDNTYFFRVSRERDEVVSILVSGTDYTYDNAEGNEKLTVLHCDSGDIIKVSYCGADANENAWVKNTTDLNFIKANSISAFLVDAATNYRVYKLDSLSLAVAFDLERIKELGTKTEILRRVRNKTVTASLRGKVSSASFDEILRGKAGEDYGVIDVTRFVDTIGLLVKCYSDFNKTAFKIGYYVSNLRYPSRNIDIAANDYLTKDISLEGKALRVSSDEMALVA
jgi:hypothetical protein